MHISEGVLQVPVLIGFGAVAAIGTGIGLKRLDFDSIMHVALLTATFFVASLIHVPLGPSSIHLVLNGLLGLILGWAAFPAILVALFLQALFFQFGGFTVLGVNTVTMALPAVLVFYLFGSLIRKEGKIRTIAAFCSGFFSILFAAILVALALYLSDRGFLHSALLFFAAQIPLMCIEGCITMFTILFLFKVHPEIFSSHP